MKVLLINGSPRKFSRSREVIRKSYEYLGCNSLNVSMFDVGLNNLPIFNDENEQNLDQNVRLLRRLSDEADAFIICTPEYHNGISGALKNALDFLGGNHFANKPALIFSTSGGGKGGINALNNLRTVLRGLYAMTLPSQFVFDPNLFDENNNLIDVTRLKYSLDEFCHYIKKVDENKIFNG